MDRWKRFVDWCQQPSKVKIRTFNPRNIMIIALSVLIISLITSGSWLYQVFSVTQTPDLNRENYESLFSTLIITEDTVLNEDHQGSIIIEADDVTLDGNGHTITGPGVWVWNSTERMWWPTSCGITVIGRSGVTVKNCHVTNFAFGLTLSNSDGCTLLNNTIYDNVYVGISVVFSVNNTILENTVHSTRNVGESYDYTGLAVGNLEEPYDYTGFGVDMSFGNTFKGNVAYDNGWGFSIGEFEIEIFEEEMGFIPEEYEDNIFEGNTAEGNTKASFWIGGLHKPPPFSNIFFHNNLIDNAIQASVPPTEYGYSNTWDDGYPSGGNYWSDYTGVDADGDGIGDTPYEIPTVSYEWDEEDPNADPIPIIGEPDGNNVDRFPLMAPFSG